jgi:hypothetical protein
MAQFYFYKSKTETAQRLLLRTVSSSSIGKHKLPQARRVETTDNRFTTSALESGTVSQLCVVSCLTQQVSAYDMCYRLSKACSRLIFLRGMCHGKTLSPNSVTCIQKDATLHSLFYLETALHVSGGTTTHHQESKLLYLQHLVFVTPLLLPAAQTSSNFFTIAAGSSNGVTNTRCCRYSSLLS